MSDTKLKPGRRRSKISGKEMQWVDLQLESGLGAIEAYRKVFNLRCEPGSSDSRRAVELKRTLRVREYWSKKEEQIVRETEAHKLFISTDEIAWDDLRKFCVGRLKEIAENETLPAQTRYNAISAMRDLNDPASDTNLILRWVDIVSRGAMAHCPKCHSSFPLHQIENSKLTEWRVENESSPVKDVQGVLERRMEILSRADKRKKPHKSQTPALRAPERHIAGTGAARAGKSLLLAWFGLLGILTPGVESWLLARTYEDARSETEYLKRFLNTLFYPHFSSIFTENYDHKTGEYILRSKWASILKVRSAKAKGSITGRELEYALAAEPGWIPEDVYEEVRARMSSRLGRIIMLGTPKGDAGILGRLVNVVGKDPKTGRVIRIPHNKRTIKSGCPWGQSLLVYSVNPKDNPEYVKSELDAARMELTDEEYASEFEGKISVAEGALFPHIEEKHLISTRKDWIQNCIFVLGVDQGPKNFAAVLLGYDGERVFVLREYFEVDNQTMLMHMKTLQRLVPRWIRELGGNPDSWELTIFDADPPLFNELEELETDPSNLKWPTAYTFRPKNKIGQFNQDNWRSDTYEFVNSLNLGNQNNLLFELETQLLHDQTMRVLVDPNKETGSSNRNKGWLINDKFRGEHILDAFVMACFTILSGALLIPDSKPSAMDPWAEAKAAFDFNRLSQERKEINGMLSKEERLKDKEIWEEQFGRKRSSQGYPHVGGYSHYKDY